MNTATFYAPGWERVYKRPPIGIDVVLFIAALLIHAPLVLFRLPSPERKSSKKIERLINVDIIEIQKRKPKVVLPPPMPKTPDIKKIVAPFKRTPPPPPPPKPRELPSLAKPPEPAKLNDKIMQDRLNQQQKLLENKGKLLTEAKLPVLPAKDIKLSGGAAAIANARVVGAANLSGPALKGKDGFQMAKGAMPLSIGGGDDIKIAGGDTVAIKTGAMARVDRSILSPVAASNKGSLATVAGEGSPGGTGKGPAGLSGGGAGGGAIAVGGRPQAIAGGGPAISDSRKFQSKASVGDGAIKSAATAPFPLLLAQRSAPRVEKPLFTITGPLANRQILTRQIPEYPEWARKKGIDSTVMLQFTVTSEGLVKENILVLRTSGYPQMDELATSALKRWKFVALPSGQFRDEVGSITFVFSIR